jgi:hypothetical protein
MKRNINVFMLFSFSIWISSIHKKVINLPVIRPSIAHGCAVWFPSLISSAQNIESLQNQAGKIIPCSNVCICIVIQLFSYFYFFFHFCTINTLGQTDVEDIKFVINFDYPNSSAWPVFYGP